MDRQIYTSFSKGHMLYTTSQQWISKIEKLKYMKQKLLNSQNFNKLRGEQEKLFVNTAKLTYQNCILSAQTYALSNAICLSLVQEKPRGNDGKAMLTTLHSRQKCSLLCIAGKQPVISCIQQIFCTSYLQTVASCLSHSNERIILSNS